MKNVSNNKEAFARIKALALIEKDTIEYCREFIKICDFIACYYGIDYHTTMELVLRELDKLSKSCSSSTRTKKRRIFTIDSIKNVYTAIEKITPNLNEGDTAIIIPYTTGEIIAEYKYGVWEVMG